MNSARMPVERLYDQGSRYGTERNWYGFRGTVGRTLSVLAWAAEDQEC